MMYHNKLAVAIKSNGKVLREKGETVYLPFGTEYSIFIKNLNNARVRLSITIDGQDVTGGGLIVNANSDCELKRSISNGNMHSGNAFKFIEMTDAISQHRGERVDDGIIRIQYQFEQPTPVYTISPPTDTWLTRRITTSDKQYSPSAGQCGTYGLADTNSVTLSNTANISATSASGITVPGQVIDQQFTTVNNFKPAKEEYVIVLQLRGQTEQGTVVKKTVDVKTKPQCTTCGHKNKATSKFCSECGTSLTIV